MRYAIAISDQGRHGPSVVGDFVYMAECNMHVFKGKYANTMAEMAEQVNAATAALAAFGNPFVTLRVVEIRGIKQQPPIIDSTGEIRYTAPNPNERLIKPDILESPERPPDDYDPHMKREGVTV